jgi:hypothetical protein
MYVDGTTVACSFITQRLTHEVIAEVRLISLFVFTESDVSEEEKQ